MSSDRSPASTADPAPEIIIAALAARVAMTLPAECEAGVRANLTVLDDHWARLRRALKEDATA